MPPYVGRFAPSPTGPLHLGSLYTAVASYLDAKAHKGKWLVRIEDIDPPREQAGASQHILQTLQAHHLFWDDEVSYQSLRYEQYDKALSYLHEHGHTYFCTCSRQQLQPYHDFYPGNCRLHTQKPTAPAAIRFIANPPAPNFSDRLLGKQSAPIPPNGLYHDFVIYRKDQLYAYQLAVVVDDIQQQVSHIVRGSDILDSTFKQLFLYQAFNACPPEYLHLPVLVHSNGQKLSKQNLAPAIDNLQPCSNLLRVLKLLHQPLPPTERQTAPDDILLWAIEHWTPDTLTPALSISS